MTSRTDLIAAVLRRPRLKRPLVAHELRGCLVQGIGPGSTDVDWQTTVPQLAEAIDTALQAAQEREEKDTQRRIQRRAGESTARAELLTVLQDAGYNREAAVDLVARAFREPHAGQTDSAAVESLAGGHALVMEFGGRELIGSCQCGRRLGRITSLESADALAGLWERHTTTELPTVIANGAS